MNPDAYKEAPTAPKPKAWVCPCSGCAKAVKQERMRLTEAIEAIDIDAPSQLNALGLKLLILDLIKPKSATPSAAGRKKE